jgi:hypothetical protein
MRRRMLRRMVWIVVAVGIGVLWAWAAEGQTRATTTLYKTFRVTQSDVGVACKNGAPPIVRHNAGDSIVVVSCEN